MTLEPLGALLSCLGPLKFLVPWRGGFRQNVPREGLCSVTCFATIEVSPSLWPQVIAFFCVTASLGPWSEKGPRWPGVGEQQQSSVFLCTSRGCYNFHHRFCILSLCENSEMEEGELPLFSLALWCELGIPTSCEHGGFLLPLQRRFYGAILQMILLPFSLVKSMGLTGTALIRIG